VRQDREKTKMRLFKPNIKKMEAEGDIEALIRTLQDPDRKVGEDSAWALVKIGKPAVDPLIRALKIPDCQVRWGVGLVAWILGKIGDNRAVEPLIQALQHSEPIAREEAAWALGEIKDVRASESLLQALRDSETAVQREAAKALEKMGVKYT
jgi:bilin biosynthesis protein